MTDKWYSYQVDSAVMFIGILIENALNETVEIGTKEAPKTAQKYELKDILEPDFRLPRPLTDEEKQVKAINWYKNRMGKTFRVSKEGVVNG